MTRARRGKRIPYHRLSIATACSNYLHSRLLDTFSTTFHCGEAYLLWSFRFRVLVARLYNFNGYRRYLPRELILPVHSTLAKGVAESKCKWRMKSLNQMYNFVPKTEHSGNSSVSVPMSALLRLNRRPINPPLKIPSLCILTLFEAYVAVQCGNFPRALM